MVAVLRPPRQDRSEDLIDDRDALACLEPDAAVAARRRSSGRSTTRFTFPPRSSGSTAATPTTRRPARATTSSPSTTTTSILRRGQAAEPAPTRADLGGGPIESAVLREALIELAESVLADDGRFPPCARLLRREPPRCAPAGSASHRRLVSPRSALDHSVLPVQGPPGTGKTYRGARMIVAALAAGRRVGITAPSHAAIQNLLREVEEHAPRSA